MPSKPYRATSLERGLAVLKALGTAGRPLRNRDVVASTGLPKSTVSRLTNTLEAMGYLSRTDNGSYVPAFSSASPGRALLAGLGLKRHTPLFRTFFSETGGEAVLEAKIGSSMASVFRWSAAGSAAPMHGAADNVQPGMSPSDACFEFAHGNRSSVDATWRGQLDKAGWCYLWSESAHQVSASTSVRFVHVGDFVLTLKVPQNASTEYGRVA